MSHRSKCSFPCHVRSQSTTSTGPGLICESEKIINEKMVSEDPQCGCAATQPTYRYFSLLPREGFQNKASLPLPFGVHSHDSTPGQVRRLRQTLASVHPAVSHQEEELSTSSACPPEPEEGLKHSCAFAASSQKSELNNGAQGHCNSQTCRGKNDNSRPQIFWGKATKRIWKQGRIAGNRFQEVDSNRL